MVINLKTANGSINIPNNKLTFDFYHKMNKKNIIREAASDCPADKGWLLARPGTTKEEEYTQNGITWVVKKCNDGKYYKINKSKLSSSSQTSDDLPDWVKNSCLKSLELRRNSDKVVYEDVLDKDGNPIWTWFYYDDNTDKDNNPLPNGKYYLKFKKNDGTVKSGTWECQDGKWRVELDGEYLIEGAAEWKRIEEEDPEEKKPEKKDPTPSPTNPCEPFEDETEANQFREWVNVNHPTVAKDIPGLDPSITSDRTLSKTGSCNNKYITAAREHKIDGKTLFELFKDKEAIESENQRKEEIKSWWQEQIDSKSVENGKVVELPKSSSYYSDHIYAYKKIDVNNPDLVFYFLKDGSWFSWLKKKGFQEEGTWTPELQTESKKKLINKLTKILKEQIIVTRKRHPKSTSDEIKKDVVKKDEIKKDEIKKDEIKKDIVKKDEPKNKELQNKKIDELKSAGYELLDDCSSYDPDRVVNKPINLKEKYPNIFDRDVCMVKYMEQSVDDWNNFLSDKSPNGFSALTKNVQGPQGEENCRTVVRNTYDAQKGNLRTNNKFVLQSVKNFVNQCHKLYKDKLGRRSNNKLEWLVYNSMAFKQLKESTNNKLVMKNSLNKNIKKHLNEIIENKKNQIVENNIITLRFNSKINNSKDMKKTFRTLIDESVKMKSVGISKELVNENLMDLIDVLYKEKSFKVKKIFNQESASFISDKIGLSEGAFLRRVIYDAFSNNSIEKTVELFNNCDYLCSTISDEVAKSLGFLDKTVEEIMSSTIKPEFKSMICPIINSIGDRMENQFSKMKTKALGKSEKSSK